MSLGLFIGSLVVLAIASLMVVLGYYTGTRSNEEYIDLDCGKNIFRDYFSGNRVTYNGKILSMGAGLGIVIGSGVFVILGLITSIIFGVKLLIERRKRSNNQTDNSYLSNSTVFPF